MKIPAFPTDGSTPVDATEAVRIAHDYLYSQYAQERGDHIAVREFDHCFTVVTRPRPVPRADPTAPPLPPEIGGGVSVIDKETGHVTFWPSLPQDVIAHDYAVAKQAGEVEHQPAWPQADVDS